MGLWASRNMIRGGVLWGQNKAFRQLAIISSSLRLGDLGGCAYGSSCFKAWTFLLFPPVPCSTGGRALVPKYSPCILQEDLFPLLGVECFLFVFFSLTSTWEITDRVTSFSTNSTVIKQSHQISSCVLSLRASPFLVFLDPGGLRGLCED